MSDAAIANIVTGVVTIVTIVVGFFTLWIKLRYSEEEVTKKVDHNTNITSIAATNAKVAAVEAKNATEDINKKLNGGIDLALSSVIIPLKQTIADHEAKDEARFKDISNMLENIKKNQLK